MNQLKIIYTYIKQILLHKKYVFEECKACGITWQGVIHDLSKFSKDELVPSAMWYFGERTPEAKIEYAKAWRHHKGINKHHWEYWTDFNPEGKVDCLKIPYKYVVEMVCDWVGAGKAYKKDEWTPLEPLIYYNRVRSGRYFHPETETLILKFLYCIKDKGLDAFHKMSKCYDYLSEYDNGEQV